ncbi:MAG: DNRLRE domain-containing protein, partial [Candidatus Bathyarchaeota archaeon]|nr:DNRLRE domain-containing protein [Candidatus Bathyarchaeota archaeon]
MRKPVYISLFLFFCMLSSIGFSTLTTVNISVSNDTYVMPANPTSNYGTLGFIKVGYASGTAWYNTLIRFDLTTLPKNISVTNAILNLYFYSNTTKSSANENYSANRMTKIWGETNVTWNTLNDSAYNILGILSNYTTMPSAVGWVGWNVTDDAECFYRGVDINSQICSNYGWLIKGMQSFPNGVSWFESRENATTALHPYLEIIYTDNYVDLNTPNDIYTYDTQPTLNFTVYGNSSLYSCEIFLNGSSNGTISAINATPTLIQVNSILKNETFGWNITCQNETNGYNRSSIIQTLGVGKISDVATTHAFRMPTQHRSFYAQGRYWVFYTINDSGTGTFYRTSLDGITWTPPSEFSSYAHLAGFSLWNNNTHIDYVAGYGNNEGLRYRSGYLNSNGTITWITSESQISETIGKNYCDEIITHDTEGYPWITAMNGTCIVGENNATIFKSSLKNGSWQTDTGFPYSVDESLTARDVLPKPILLDNGQIYIIAAQSSTLSSNKVYGILWNGSTFTYENVSTSNVSIDYFGEFSAVSYGNDVYLVFTNLSSDIVYQKRTWGSGWSSEISLNKSTATFVSPVISSDDWGNLYVIWSGGIENERTGSTFFYRKFYQSNSTWGPLLVLKEASPGRNILRNDFHSIYYNTMNNEIGLAYQTNDTTCGVIISSTTCNSFIEFTYLTATEDAGSINVTTITQNYPNNNAFNTSSNISFGFTPIFYGGVPVNCSLYTNNSGTWQFSTTNQSIVNNNTLNSLWFNVTGLNITWSIGCYGGGLMNYSSNRTLNINNVTTSMGNSTIMTAIAPNNNVKNTTTRTIQFKFNATYLGGTPVNCSLYTNETSWSSKQLNQTPVYNKSIMNITYTFAGDGNYTWAISCWDQNSQNFTANRTLDISLTLNSTTLQVLSLGDIYAGDTRTLKTNVTDLSTNLTIGYGTMSF